MKRGEKRVRLELAAAFFVVACGASGEGGDPTEIDLPMDCVEGLTVCASQNYQVCRGGQFVHQETCVAPETCAPGYGCSECPASGQLCVDDVLHACTPAGVGDPIEHCAGGCTDGQCLDDCAEGTDLIYVVDSDYDLLSFDPTDDTFRTIGRLSCPAADSWPRWGQREATPFSMSVDRGGRAWVLFTSGEIFWVDTSSSACRASGFEPGQSSFQLFGMGFVSDEPGSSRETLFVAGGAVGALGGGTLGAIDPGTLALTPVGRMPDNEFGAELTGNANAELHGYFPGDDTQVARIDKSSGDAEQTWPLPPLGQPRAWAFAHWGGRYYIFISSEQGDDVNEQVLRFNPVDGTVETVLSNTGHRIVGAGVSTCAPTVANF